MTAGKGPYIQVALDALALYPRVAMMAGIDIAHVHMGFNELWCHCFRAKVDHIPRALLAGFFPETPKLLETLVACGFVEPTEDGLLRVRGIEGRYNPTSSKAEAGRKGGLKTAAKAVREGGRFTKQPSSDQAEHQAATKHGEVLGSPSTTEHTKHEPSRVPSTGEADDATKLTPSTKHEPSTAPGTPPSSDQADQANHQALNPRCSLSSSPLRGEREPRARVEPKPPTRPPPVDLSAEQPHGTAPPPEWPNAECEKAGLAWYEKLREKRPMGHGYTVDDAKRIAMEYPDTFAEAAHVMASSHKPWVGWGTDLLAWLRRQCGYVEAERLDRAQRERDKKRAPGDRYSPSFRQGRDPGATQQPAPATSSAKQAEPSRFAAPVAVTRSESAEARWLAAREKVRLTVEPWDHAQWLVPLVAAGEVEGVTVLAAPDESHASWVDEHFAGFIATHLGHTPRLTTWAAVGLEGAA